MAATRNPLRDFILTPQQQSLLFAALNSNKQATEVAPANASRNMSPTSLTESPVQTLNSVQESPFLDYDYDFGTGDSSFDFSFDNGNQMKMIGDLPGEADSSKSASPEGDSPDKRSHPEDEAEEKEESSNKRRESEEKVAKKPGRKPLTSEPSSKRKAQNRAAQRAFRERKEQHLKDLEEKVEELQKSTEQTNSENSALKAQVDKMTIELAEYKKRLTVVSTKPTPSAARPGFGAPAINNLNDVNFQFEFPKFGTLPGSTSQSFNALKRLSSAPSFATSLTRTPSGQISPTGENPQPAISPSNSSNYSQIGLDAQTRDDLAKFSTSLFGVSGVNKDLSNNSRTSFDSVPSLVGGTNTSSPSNSTTSNMGPSSSAGTSPEPFTQSPMGFKAVETMTTIGEEQPSVTNTGRDMGTFPGADDFTWLASQNNFQFDPQLYGDYREPQENIIGTSGLDDTFFNDAFAVDFTTPYNMAPSPVAQKKAAPDLVAQIDAANNGDEVGPDGQLLTCNSIWEKLQGCQRVQNGDFDLDGLCQELQTKAKCSGNGPVVNEKDFKKVMGRYLGKTEAEMADCDVIKAEGVKLSA